jgi:protein-S-isoprenylcysteine O-methyltransferase Ste14
MSSRPQSRGLHMSRGRMIASKVEYRYRFWLIAFVFVVAYSFYNLDHVNVLYAVVAFGDDAHLKDLPVRMLYALSALLAGIGATMLTWVAAYRSVSTNKGESQKTDFCISGPFRYVRNPHYLGYFLLLAGLSSFQSRLGFPVTVTTSDAYRDFYFHSARGLLPGASSHAGARP